MLKNFKYFDWPLFVAILLLALTGLIMIYSTGLTSKLESKLWVRQLIVFGIGLVIFFSFSNFDYRFYKKNSTTFYILAIILLVGVLLFGQKIRGASRWFNLGFVNFQPSEFAKLALIILLAKYFQLKKPMLAKFRYVLASFGYVLILAIPILAQPDLGSTGMLVAIWLGMLLISSMPRRFFVYLAVFFLIVAVASWQFLLHDYQKDRLRSFANPISDPLGRGYNVIQSMVAVGSGGLWGQGLARGLQSQLKFLPEKQTDFIFASTVEELGMLGGGFVLFLFGYMLYRIMKIMRNARDLFGTYLGAGIFFVLFMQIAVNIGMNLGLLPVTGVTLPFLSYGGSSLLITFWLLGIMENIAKNSAPIRFG